jgi:hypothetical protein
MTMPFLRLPDAGLSGAPGSGGIQATLPTFPIATFFKNSLTGPRRKISPRGIPMSSTTNYFEKSPRSARKKYGSDIASIIVIVFGVAALLILLCPR